MISRRRFIAAGGSGLLVAGCDRLDRSERFRGVLRSAEGLTMKAQRLVAIIIEACQRCRQSCCRRRISFLRKCPRVAFSHAQSNRGTGYACAAKRSSPPWDKIVPPAATRADLRKPQRCMIDFAVVRPAG